MEYTTKAKARKVPELLAPAGNREQLDAALRYGADAVYLGGSSLNLRAGSRGFDGEALSQAVADAHAVGAKVYYCLNVLPQQRHMAAIEACLEAIPERGVDGLIVADPGVIWLTRRYCPDIPLHLSTQANTANAYAVAFWKDLGFSRVNLARELDCRSIAQMVRQSPDMEFEAFVHGAQCLALSGRCLLSAWLNGRSANLGRCTHPCRFEYQAEVSQSQAEVSQSQAEVSQSHESCACQAPEINAEGYPPKQETFTYAAERMPHLADGMPSLAVHEQTRPNQTTWEVTQDSDGFTEGYSTFWAPQDLALVRFMNWYAKLGIAAVKVEGRVKTGSYVAQVVDVYRTALNDAAIFAHRNKEYINELLHTASRPLSTGFFLPSQKRHTWPQPELSESATPHIVALINGKAEGPLPSLGGNSAYEITVKSPWDASMPATLLATGMRRPVMKAGEYQLENHRGQKVDRLHPGMRGILHCDMEGLEKGLYIRA